jgi:hypothetical protein
MIKRHRKQLVFSFIILLVGCAVVAGLLYFNDKQSAIQRYHDRSHDTALIIRTNTRLDAEMKESMHLLSPQLAVFGLGIPAIPKSECFEGDPALYKYGCWTRIDLGSSGPAQALGTAEDAAQKLMDFNAIMSKNGWKIAHNDFRNSSAGSAPEQWATAIAPYPADVNYIKGECMVEFFVRLANQPDNGDSNGSLSCGADLLPGFYY